MGAKYEDPKHIITIPASKDTGEKTQHVAVNESVYKELTEMQGQTNALIDLNRQALETRKKLREATTNEAFAKNPKKAAEARALYMRQLTDLNNQRASLAEKARDPNSAVRDPEFNRQIATGVDYTAGFLGKSNWMTGDVEKQIQHNSNAVQATSDAKLRGATGQVVKHAIDRDQRGRVVNQWLPTGQIYNGRPVTPEKK